MHLFRKKRCVCSHIIQRNQLFFITCFAANISLYASQSQSRKTSFRHGNKMAQILSLSSGKFKNFPNMNYLMYFPFSLAATNFMMYCIFSNVWDELRVSLNIAL